MVISTQLGIPTSTTLQRIVQNNCFTPLNDITSRLNSSLDITLHNITVRKYLHDEGLSIYVTLKFGDGLVMFWGYFGWHKVGSLVVVKGSMDSDQDGASCYISNYSIWWMKTHNIPILD
ncbi:13952_t:CDS:2 [Funneliformis geosporum]|uniref:13952_t:CDS:1 n=1 Tax=Funneliformis geosporum TaxID=1117311 RepID=A0A9W4WVD8_9GLOM|nr:13952_t:CDS:2 [Funneliformis geosporum]